MGNLRSIAIGLLKDHCATFSLSVIEDIITQLSILAPEKEAAIREVLNRLLQNPQSLKAHHYNSFENIGGQRVNMYNIALAIMYYAHTHHLKDVRISSSREVITQNASKGLAEVSKTCDSATVQALLDSGADPSTADDLGRTALMHVAMDPQDPSVIKVLLNDRRADVNAKDNGGKTALMLAIQHSKNLDIITALLGHRAIDIDTRDNNGKTALMLASQDSSPEIVILLLQKGAELKLPDLRSIGFSNISSQEDLLKTMVERLPHSIKEQRVFCMLRAYLLNFIELDEVFVNDMMSEIKDEGMLSKIENVIKKRLHEENLPRMAQEWGRCQGHDILLFKERDFAIAYRANISHLVCKTACYAGVMCSTSLMTAGIATILLGGAVLIGACCIITGTGIAISSLHVKQTEGTRLRDQFTKLLEDDGFDSEIAALLADTIAKRIMKASGDKIDELARLSIHYINSTVGDELGQVTPMALQAIGKDELVKRCKKIVDSAERAIDQRSEMRAGV